MVIAIKFQGGLGNQMFQYCLGRRLADKLGTRLIADVGYYQKAKHCKYELNKFNARIDDPTPEDTSTQFKLVQEGTMSFIPEVLELEGDVMLQGYWQNPKYLDDRIVKELIPSKIFSSPLWDKSSATAIHIRGGDYRGWKKFATIDYTYYNRAVEYIRDNSDCNLFVVYTDDTSYAEYMLYDVMNDSKVIFAEPNGVYDILEMAGCKHRIIANSTFSLWADIFSNKEGITIAPDTWFNPEPGNNHHIEIDPYLPHMIKLKSQV